MGSAARDRHAPAVVATASRGCTSAPKGSCLIWTAFYGQLRVAVAPVRFGAGVKLKTLEALQYGVPVVATTIGAEGLEALPAEAVAVHDDPVAFAAAIVARLRDVEVWRAHRQAIDVAMAAVPPPLDWRAWLADMVMEDAGVSRPV